MDPLFKEFFTSWYFAREVLNCKYRELEDRVQDLLTTKPVLEIRSRLSNRDAKGWVNFLSPWPWMFIPAASLTREQFEGLLQCMDLFCLCEPERSSDTCTSRGFCENERLASQYYDPVQCVRACFTFAVLQLEAAGMKREHAVRIIREQMKLQDPRITLLSEKEAPDVYKEATKQSLFYE